MDRFPEKLVVAIGGNATHTVGASASRSVSGDDVLAVGRNLTEFVGGAHDLGISGDETLVVAGNCTTKIGGDHVTTVAGTATLDAKQATTVNGAQIKLGTHAEQPIARGLDFGRDVLGPISSAANGLVLGAATANAIAAAFPGPPLTTPATVATLSAAISAFGTAVVSAIAAYPGALSKKVKTE